MRGFPQYLGRLSEVVHGPKTQAIRNKTGEQYRALIQSWAEFKKPIKVNTNKVKKKYAWVNDITNPQIKWLVLDLLAEKSRLTGQLHLAKEQANIHIDLRPTTKNEHMADSLRPTLNKPELLPTELKALSNAIDPVELSKKEWTVDELGKVKDNKGNVIFKSGFINAIEKILSLS